jgi:hypothetical protein
MKYFEFKRSSEPKVTGIRNGTAQSYLSDYFLNKNPMINDYLIVNRQEYMSGKLPKEDKLLLGLPLCRGAKLTDFISVGGLLYGIIMNQKTKEIFEAARLPKHKFYPVEFISEKDSDKIISGYWWFLYELELGNNINFKESVFEISTDDKNSYPWLKKFLICSIEDYNKVTEALTTSPAASKLVLKPSFDKELDIWGTRRFADSKYISERLANSLEKRKISNFELLDPMKKYLMPIIPPCELVFQ